MTCTTSTGQEDLGFWGGGSCRTLMVTGIGQGSDVSVTQGVIDVLDLAAGGGNLADATFVSGGDPFA